MLNLTVVKAVCRALALGWAPIPGHGVVRAMRVPATINYAERARCRPSAGRDA